MVSRPFWFEELLFERSPDGNGARSDTQFFEGGETSTVRVPRNRPTMTYVVAGANKSQYYFSLVWGAIPTRGSPLEVMSEGVSSGYSPMWPTQVPLHSATITMDSNGM